MKILTSGEYFGNQDKELSFDGIFLSKYRYTVEKTKWHYHENPYFMFVLEGNMMDANAKKSTPCSTGSIMFNNWQEVHYGQKCSERASGFHLELENSWFVKNEASSNLPEGSLLIQSPKTHLLFAKLYYEFLHFDPACKVAIEAPILEICRSLSTTKEIQQKKTPTWIAKLREILHHDTSHLTLNYLSSQLDVHPVHISRSAPKYLSLSIGEYLRQVKLKKAIQLLLESRDSLTQIAYQAGFSDQSHFNYVFKSYFKMNPGLYKKSVGKKC